MQTVPGFKHPLAVSGDYSKVNLALLLVHSLAGLQQKKAGYKGLNDSFLKDTIFCLQLWAGRGGKKSREKNVSAMLQYNVHTLLS